MTGCEKNSCGLMQLSLFQIGYLSFPIGQLVSKVFQHGSYKLVSGCLIIIMHTYTVAKVQYKLARDRTLDIIGKVKIVCTF